MKKMTYLILIGEIIAICVLHATKSTHSFEAVPSAIDKRAPIDIERPAPSYIAFQQTAFYK